MNGGEPFKPVFNGWTDAIDGGQFAVGKTRRSGRALSNLGHRTSP
jgi:hypothetical protein